MELKKLKQIIKEEIQNFIVKLNETNNFSSFGAYKINDKEAIAKAKKDGVLNDDGTHNESYLINLKNLYQRSSSASDQEADDYIKDVLYNYQKSFGASDQEADDYMKDVLYNYQKLFRKI